MGFTPLQIAVYAQQEDVVAYLILIGANQRHCDSACRNVVHNMLASYSDASARTDATKLHNMMELFDKEALKKMLLERCSDSPGALTPMAYWMAKNNGIYKKADIVEVLSQYSCGEELEMINGEGDLPLHVVRTPIVPLLLSSSHFVLDGSADCHMVQILAYFS